MYTGTFMCWMKHLARQVRVCGVGRVSGVGWVGCWYRGVRKGGVGVG
jgi:hypothetical protein